MFLCVFIPDILLGPFDLLPLPGICLCVCNQGALRIIPRPWMWAISFSLFPKEIVDGIALSKTHVVSFKLLLCPKQGTGFIKLTGEFTDNFLEKPFKTKKLC